MPVARPPAPTRGRDPQLEELKAKVLALAALVEQSVGAAAEAVVAGDCVLARATVERDQAVDALTVECDDLIRRMVPLHKAGKEELRGLLAAVRAINELERIRDLSAAICEGVLFLEETPVDAGAVLAGMEQLVRWQVSRALKALAGEDAGLARDTIAGDQAVDERYRAVFRNVLSRMLDNPHHISDYMVVSDIAKTLEWIGDHATNIGEAVIYAALGHEPRHPGPLQAQAAT